MPQFEVPKGIQKRYDLAKERFSKERHILLIQECPTEDFAMPANDRLAKYGHADYTTIEMFSQIIDENAAGDDKVAGRAVPVQGPAGRRTAIFLRERFDDCPSEALFWVAKMGVLYHEVGHADDYRRGLNVDFETKTMNLQAAEEYADAFAKKHLSWIACTKLVKGKPKKSNLWEVYNTIRYQGRYRQG